MKKLFVLTPVVLLCLLNASVLAQPTANYIFNETAPGTWDILVEVAGAETAGLSAYEVWVDGVSASFAQNTLSTATAGFMPGTLVQGDIGGNFNAANYQGAAITGGVAIQGIGKTVVSEPGPPPVYLGAQARLGTLYTPLYLGAGDFRTPTVGLLNAAGDGFLNTESITPTLQVNPLQPTVHYTFQETAPGSWNVLVDVAGAYTAGLAAYDIWVDIDPTSVSYTENTLATDTAGFMPGTLVQGNVAGSFNAANYQGCEATGGVAIQGIGKTAVSEAGTPAVTLDAQALLGVLSTPEGLGETDFRVTTAGLLNMAGDGFLDTDLLVPTMDVIPFVPYLMGDANKDGVVSAGDYASVQANFGNTGAAGGSLIGDANKDGVVSAGDYASVQANFGNTASSSDAQVPEPATMTLLALSGVALLRRKNM